MKQRRKQKYLYKMLVTLLCIILVLSLIIGITFGTVHIPVKDVYTALLGRFITSFPLMSEQTYNIIWLIRLPRLILAFCVGVILSVSGLVMQALVKNPIAEPYILGVSSGAYAGATLAILLGIGSYMGNYYTGIVAFIGALVASFTVLFVAHIGGKTNAIKLVLAGTGINALCSAFSNFIIYITQDKNQLQQLVYWTMGSFAGANWPMNKLLLVLCIFFVIFFWSQYRILNLMLLGEESAITLGTDLQPFRILYTIICAILVGLAVNAAGMIAFVGLVIPHIVRMLCGINHKKLVPVCALLGGTMLMWADIACRVLIPGNELPIGILTSLIGAPCFIYLLSRKKYQYGGVE